ncbi:MAG: TIGR01459 family HAD-type hydrolase [Proteobacteria bacterium]|nr:TIGR01459 family HAD-type hydrolase [Pseudomonadota bacterium]
MDDIRLCQGISELCDSYTGYIIDQWGVLHDGNRPYEGVIEALTELKNRKKQIIVLSNSGKRAEDNAKRLQTIGFDMGLFDHIITSGELTWLGLKNRTAGVFEGLGDKCYLISRAGDTKLVDGLGLTLVDKAEDATFILVSGVDDPPKGRTVADLEPVLRVGVQKRLKMICANPDLQALIGTNTHAGAGAVAKRYEEFGGIVRYIGKPFPPIFRHAQTLFKDTLPSTTVVIGDSLPQDIMGGLNCGLDTCLTATGIHAAAFKGVKSVGDCAKVLRVLGVNFGVRPNFWIPRLHWGKPLLDRKNKRRKLKA